MSGPLICRPASRLGAGYRIGPSESQKCVSGQRISFSQRGFYRELDNTRRWLREKPSVQQQYVYGTVLRCPRYIRNLVTAIIAQQHWHMRLKEI